MQRDDNLTRDGGRHAPFTPPSAARPSLECAVRRRAAAEWVEALTGSALPYSSDHAFRAALQDGVLLCRAVNASGLLTQVGAWWGCMEGNAGHAPCTLSLQGWG